MSSQHCSGIILKTRIPIINIWASTESLQFMTVQNMIQWQFHEFEFYKRTWNNFSILPSVKWAVTMAQSSSYILYILLGKLEFMQEIEC